MLDRSTSHYYWIAMHHMKPTKMTMKVEFLSRVLWFPSFSGRKLRCCLSLKKILNFVSPDEMSWRLLKLKFFSLRSPKIPPQFGYTSSTKRKLWPLGKIYKNAIIFKNSLERRRWLFFPFALQKTFSPTLAVVVS